MRTDKDRARAKELFRKMSPKEKAAHVFRYYWMHMVAVVVVIGMVVSISASVRESRAREGLVYVVLQEGYEADLRPAVETMAAEAAWPEELNFASFPSIEDQEVTGAYQLTLYLAADQVDIIVCDEPTMQVLREDDTLGLSVVPLGESALGERVSFHEPLYVAAVGDTGRGEKAEQFRTLLLEGAG